MDANGPTDREWQAMLDEIKGLKNAVAGIQKITPEEVTALRRIAALGVVGKLLVVCLGAVTVFAVAASHLKAAIKGWLA